MKNSKGEAISNLIFGLVFAAIGALLLLMKSELLIVNIIAGADLVLGAILLIGGIVGMGKKDAPKPANNVEFDRPAPKAKQAPKEEAWDKPADSWDAVPVPVAAPIPIEQPAEPELTTVPETVESLAAREAELRKVVKQRRAEARQAAEAAEQASNLAAAAEQRLVDAENDMKHVNPADQRAALARIDKLADEAMDLSQQSAVAARKAKSAERAYKKAVEDHRIAMDAAAEAMAADDNWN